MQSKNDENVDKSYNLLLNGEPSDEQLEMLMQAVLQEVRKQTANGNQKVEAFQMLLMKESELLRKQYKERYGKE